MKPRTIPFADFIAEGTRLFGEDRKTWRFRCPICGHVASVKDWEDLGAPKGAVAFACVGRWIEGSRKAFGDEGVGPCNYTGGGLFALNPVRVVFPDGEETTFFDFALTKAA